MPEPTRRSTPFLPELRATAERLRAPRLFAAAVDVEHRAGALWMRMLVGTDARPDDLRAALAELRAAATELHGPVGGPYAGPHNGPRGDQYRRADRAARAITDAVAEGDGASFARAFARFDQYLASAVVCAGASGPGRMEPDEQQH